MRKERVTNINELGSDLKRKDAEAFVLYTLKRILNNE